MVVCFFVSAGTYRNIIKYTNSDIVPTGDSCHAVVITLFIST